MPAPGHDGHRAEYCMTCLQHDVRALEQRLNVPPELRQGWQALVEADTLHLLPVEALIASIRHLAIELLTRATP